MENNANVTTLNNTNMSASQIVPQHFKLINRQVSHLHSDIISPTASIETFIQTINFVKKLPSVDLLYMQHALLVVPFLSTT